MIVRAPHLQDDVLYDCYYASRRGEAIDPPSAEHLSDCQACSNRYAEVGTFLNTLSEEADAEVAALFPADRLRAQQQDIARRIELIGRAARVISFPRDKGRAAAHVAAGTQAPQVSHRAARWIAVAAAAGLFVGVAAGTLFNGGARLDVARDARRPGAVASRRVSTPAPSRLSSSNVEEAVVDMDEMFMSDLETVLDRPHTSELVAFDALTPHVRDARDFPR
jgi:hypothetical protein